MTGKGTVGLEADRLRGHRLLLDRGRHLGRQLVVTLDHHLHAEQLLDRPHLGALGEWTVVRLLQQVGASIPALRHPVDLNLLGHHHDLGTAVRGHQGPPLVVFLGLLPLVHQEVDPISVQQGEDPSVGLHLVRVQPRAPVRELLSARSRGHYPLTDVDALTGLLQRQHWQRVVVNALTRATLLCLLAPMVPIEFCEILFKH